MEFKVKRDFLQIFLTNLVLVFLLTCTVLYFSQKVGYLVVFLIIAVTILALYDTAVIFASCRIDENTLTFRTGVFKYTIDLSQVIKVSRAKNIYNSLALSYDRIRILTAQDGGKTKVYYIAVDDNEKLAGLLAPAAKKTEAAKPVEVEEAQPATEENAPAKKTTTKKATTKKATAKKPAAKKATTAAKKAKK